MKQIKSETELLKQLYLDIDECGKKKIVFLGGHFPLIYTEKGAIEAFDFWGIFSPYSLELACKIGKYARMRGKQIYFVFFVDDHIYEKLNNLSNSQVSLKRNKIYKKMSEKNAKLPKLYKKIMNKYGFSEKDIIRQNQMKKGRENCLYFSEKILQASKRKIDNPCAREYVEFLEDNNYFDKENSHMITFAPQRCKDNICDFAIGEIKGLSSSHIFIDTMAKFASKKEIYKTIKGIGYRKD